MTSNDEVGGAAEVAVEEHVPPHEVQHQAAEHRVQQGAHLQQGAAALVSSS